MKLNKYLPVVLSIILIFFMIGNLDAQVAKEKVVRDKVTKTGTVNPPKKSDKYLDNNKKKKKIKPKISVVRGWECPCYGNYKSKANKKRNKKMQATRKKYRN